MTQLNSLRALFTGYLNQDWDCKYPDPWAAVADFVEYEPEHRFAVLNDIRELLEGSVDDEALHLRLRGLNLGYYPITDDITTYRQWLEILSKEIGEPDAAGRRPSGRGHGDN